MLRALVTTAALCLGLFAAGAGQAQSARVVLVDPDPELESALRVTLTPWNTAIDVQQVAGPGSTMPGSAARARELASKHDAQAVVWVSEAEDGLHFEDSDDDLVVSEAEIEAATPLECD